jgi:hypothetical protein
MKKIFLLCCSIMMLSSGVFALEANPARVVSGFFGYVNPNAEYHAPLPNAGIPDLKDGIESVEQVSLLQTMVSFAKNGMYSQMRDYINHGFIANDDNPIIRNYPYPEERYVNVPLNPLYGDILSFRDLKFCFQFFRSSTRYELDPRMVCARGINYPSPLKEAVFNDDAKALRILSSADPCAPAFRFPDNDIVITIRELADSFPNAKAYFEGRGISCNPRDSKFLSEVEGIPATERLLKENRETRVPSLTPTQRLHKEMDYAIESRDYEKIEDLLKGNEGAILDNPCLTLLYPRIQPPLRTAVVEDDIKAIDMLINAGADPCVPAYYQTVHSVAPKPIRVIANDFPNAKRYFEERGITCK